jgi:ankyrin repeat protein
LHYAALEGHRDVAKLLLAGGANVNAESTSGETPLALADGHGHTDMVELLQQHGGHK